MFPSDTTKYYIQSGYIRVTSSCRVTGNIGDYNIIDAQINSGKNVISGVGDASSSALYLLFNFNAIKQQ
jgi:hypothetical protein